MKASTLTRLEANPHEGHELQGPGPATEGRRPSCEQKAEGQQMLATEQNESKLSAATVAE